MRDRYKEFVKINGVPNKEDTIQLIEQIENERTKALVSLSYLTAGRVSEICGELKKKHFTEITKMIKYGLDMEKERTFIEVHMPNRKNKTIKSKKIPIPMDRDYEIKIMSFVMDYIAPIYEERVIFPFSRQRADQLIKLHAKQFYHHHFLRGLRLSHLVVYNGYDGQRLVKFAGWTDSRPAKWYMMLSTDDLMRNL